MMKYFAVSAFLIATPALACDYCDQTVTLNGMLADCYLARVDAEIQDLEDAGLPAQLINLASCEGVSSETRGAGSMPIPVQGAVEPDTSFLLDKAGLQCLRNSVSGVEWGDGTAQTFEVYSGC